MRYLVYQEGYEVKTERGGHIMSDFIPIIPEVKKTKLIPFHIGIVVANLDNAIKHFSDVFGISFGQIKEVTLNAHGSSEGNIKIKVTYSNEGPLILELIEGTDQDSFFSLKNGEGFHHLGVWSEDFDAYQERAEKNKLPVEVSLNIMPGNPTFWFSDPADLNGTRIEFLNKGMRKGIEDWILGEDVLQSEPDEK